MSKRFTGTDKWDQDWFLDMPVEYKLFYLYVLDKCDHVGIFKVNLRSFKALLELDVNPKTALELFNNDRQRIRVLSDSKWFIEDFIYFQYGSKLNENNRVHKSILNSLDQNEINLRSIRGLKDPDEGAKEKDKDKDMDKDKDKDKNNKGVVLDFETEVKERIWEQTRIEVSRALKLDTRQVNVLLDNFIIAKIDKPDEISNQSIPETRSHFKAWCTNNYKKYDLSVQAKDLYKLLPDDDKKIKTWEDVD